MTTFTQDLTFNLKRSLDKIFEKKVLDPMVCVEIGSFEGKGSILIHNKLCDHPESKLICIDPLDDEYVKGNKNLSFWNEACNGQKHRFYSNTKLYPKISILQGTSNDMIPTIKDRYVDFAYIDGDHSPDQVYTDAINIFYKMKPNSIILFDDYLWSMNNITTKYGIDKFLDEYKEKYTLLFKDYQVAIRIN